MITEPLALVLSSINAATDIAKLITNSSHVLEKAELNLKLAEIITNLADAKIEMTNTKELLSEKDLEIKKLKEQAQKVHELKFVAPVYKNDNGEDFCTRCFDVDSKAVRLQRVSPSEPEFLKCLECKISYETEASQRRRNQSYKRAQENYITGLEDKQF